MNTPTAQEFYAQCREGWDVNGDYPPADPIRFAIEFAKLHLQAATDEHAYWCNRDNREDLINSYPLTNIK